MAKLSKNILAVAGIISAIVGVVIAVPTLINQSYLSSVLAFILVISGLIMLAVAFGD